MVAGQATVERCIRTLCVTLAAVLAVVASPPTHAQPRRRDPVPVSVAWRGVPLRDACARLGSLVGRPVILDRRVDPDIPVTLDLDDVPLPEALARFGAASGTGCAVLETTIRIVPRGGAAGVVAEEGRRRKGIDDLPAGVRTVARARAPWAWADGATPRDLVASAAEDAGVVLDGLDALPHDHLAAADLPSLALDERIDIVLLPAALRVDWPRARARDGRVHVPVVAVPRNTGDETGPAVMAAAGAWDGPALPRPPTPRVPGGEAWSLEVAAPLDRLLATVAGRLGLELRLDRDGLRRRGIPADEIVRLSVENVGRDELLDRIVEPLGLRWRIDGESLHVGPADGG